MGRQSKEGGASVGARAVVISGPFIKFLLHNHNIKKIIKILFPAM